VGELGQVVSLNELNSRQGLVSSEANSADSFANIKSSKCSVKRVIGYVPKWSKVPFTFKQSLQLTHLIFAFAEMGPDGSVTIPNRR